MSVPCSSRSICSRVGSKKRWKFDLVENEVIRNGNLIEFYWVVIEWKLVDLKRDSQEVL
jgi:hypothetical protein